MNVYWSHRRNLAVCPILEGEDRLRLLNLQHNTIKKIQNLSHLRRLVFLDLYDNQINQISGIDELTSLRVLMLGKNRIENISGLGNLHRLDVLDLHGNRVGLNIDCHMYVFHCIKGCGGFLGCK